MIPAFNQTFFKGLGAKPKPLLFLSDLKIESTMYQVILPGQFLVAKSMLKGSYFENAVIFLAQSSRTKGCLGFVINRQSMIPVNEILGGVPKENWRPVQIHLGGPVNEQEIHILQLGNTLVDDANEVVSGIWLGGDFSDMDVFVEHAIRSPRVWLILGYTGWAAMQLEKEIEEGCWELVTVDPTLVFSENPRGFSGNAYDFLDRYSQD